jgi:Protein of unknown function (DUF4241)
MNLPVSEEYLSLAFKDGVQTKQATLKHHHVGNLLLITGELVACDPFVCVDSEPFALELPRGSFPLVLSVAHIETDQRVAFATLLIRPTQPESWTMLTLGDQDLSKLKDGEIFGYPVDSGTGCFMDSSALRALEQKMREQEMFYETMIAEMDKTYIHTWNWLNMTFGEANLIAFSSGFGDGVYATYAGYDKEGQISAVVTDFGILET